MDRKDSLKNMFQDRPEVKSGYDPAVDDPDALPIAKMDGKYSTLRPANKTLTRMHVVLKDGKVRSFQYLGIDVEGVYDGSTFTVTFVGVKHWQITVKGHGPKFWTVYDYVTQHRWPYLREATDNEAKFAEKEETVFTEIKIVDVTPKPGE